jgi:hypothetical protein
MPAGTAYFDCQPARIEAWAKRLPGGRVRVGITWQGRPDVGIGGSRSIPLQAFASLSRIPGVVLISLQKHHGLGQLANLPAGMRVETLGDDFDSGPDAFVDSAAVMMNLDLESPATRPLPISQEPSAAGYG